VVGVTTTTGHTRWFGQPLRVPAEVIALLVDDGAANAVATVAVREAAHRQAPVRFLQVVPTDLDGPARAQVEESTFRAGLQALRGHPRTASVFEVVRRSPSAAVRRRSRTAALMVIGVADPPAPEHQSLAERCALAAACPVHTVPVAL
jgi:hypothetical protein